MTERHHRPHEDDTRRHIQWGAHTHTDMLCGDQWMPNGNGCVGCTKVKGHTGLHEWDFHADGIPKQRWWRCEDGRTIPPPYGQRLLAYFNLTNRNVIGTQRRMT